MSADTQGLLYSRGIYIDPWAIYYTDPGINSYHYATTSGYFQSAPYTEDTWTTYWNLVCDDMNNMHVDVVMLGVGTKYFESKRQDDPTIEPGWEKIEGNQARYLWYDGDGWLNWTIDKAHEHGIKVLLWQAINKINNDDYIGAIDYDEYYAKGRYDRTGPNPVLSVSTYRFDYSSPVMRALYCDQLGYAIAVTPELDGVIFEEPYMYFTGGGAWGYVAYPSYGDPSVDRYIELYGSSPLIVTETETVFLRMADINIEGLNLFFAELQDSIMGNTTKEYPYFIMATNTFEWKEVTDRYLDVTNWSENEYLDMYGLQTGVLTTEAQREYYQQQMVNNYPNLACWYIVPITRLSNPTYAPYIYPTIDSAMTYGGHMQVMFAYNSVTLSYNGVVLRNRLIQYPPPSPTYNETQEQEESPITNPNATYVNEIKKSSPNSIFSSYLDDINYIGIGANVAGTSEYRMYEHEHVSIPDEVTNAIITYTKMGNASAMTGSMVIELYNASNSTNCRSWSTNHTTWNNYTLNTSWGAAGGDWYDLNNELRGSVPICSFITNVTDPIGTTYDCNITSLAQNAIDGINLLLKSPNASTSYKYTWFYGPNAANSSYRPYITFTPTAGFPPSIINQWNNQTENDSLEISFQLPGSIEFWAEANQTVDRWYWSADDVLQNETSANYTSQLFVEGNHTVSTYCENNSLTSSTITWNINVTGTESYQPDTPANVTVYTGLGFINVSWDMNGSNIVDFYRIIDEDTEQPFDTTQLYYNLTDLEGREYNITLYALNTTNTTTASTGYNFLEYPSINTTNNYYNHTSSFGKNVTIYVRAYNSTYDTYSDWVEQTVTMSGDLPDCKFEYWDGYDWQEGESDLYLWFYAPWNTSGLPDGVSPNAEQSETQHTLKITNNGTASGYPKVRSNMTFPAEAIVYIDDDHTVAGSISLNETYQVVGPLLDPGENVSMSAWVALYDLTETIDFDVFAIVE